MFLGVALLLCGSAALSYAFTLPDTGQTKCYNLSGTEIACAGTGQDGAYIINAMSYTDNGNGTITDNVTELIWQKGENPSCNWYQASGTYDATYNTNSTDVCGSLNLGGYTDWRLPTKKELISIVDYSIPYPGTTINTTYFPNAGATDYWSSTYAVDPGYAWTVYFNAVDRWNGDFFGGSVVSYYKCYGFSVRCVRGGQ